MTLSARVFLQLLAVAVLGMPFDAGTQQAQRSARLGILYSGSPATSSPATDAFLKRLAVLGWVEGKNLVVARRYAEHPDRFPALAAELVAQKVSVILTPGPLPTRAAVAATRSVPIVMVAFTDPVAAGLVASLARPGENLTGLTVAHPGQYTGKRLELLKQAIPGLGQVVALWDASLTPPAREWTEVLDREARTLGLRLEHATVRNAAEIDAAFGSARARGVGAVLVMETPLFSINASLIAESCVKHRLPAMTLFSQAVERGALVSYGPNLIDLFLRAAEQVDRILRGESPASIPIEQPSTFDLVINLKTAKAIGITIPPAFLLRANKVIE